MRIGSLYLLRTMSAAAVLVAAAPWAQAGGNVYYSVDAAVALGVNVGVSNVPPAPVYVQPAPVLVTPRPVFVPQPVYVQPAPYVEYEREHEHGHRGHERERRRHHEHHHDEDD